MSIYSQKFIDMLMEFHLAARDNNAEAEQEELIAYIDAQMERDRKDAARYRFLRNGASNNRVPHITQYPAQEFDNPRMPQIRDVGLDAAIDAAIDTELAKNKKEIDAG